MLFNGLTNTISYHPNGLVNQVAHANSIGVIVTDTHTLDPNKMLRPRQIKSMTSGAATVWDSGLYEFDGSGNVTEIGNAYFLYDPVSRLKESRVDLDPLAAGVYKTQKYVIDAFGNLKEIQMDGGNVIPVDAATNRLNAPGTTYDRSGSLLNWNGQTYEVDANGQMCHFKSAGGAEDWLYFYTADEERVWSYKLGGSNINRWTLRNIDGKVLREYISDSSGWRIENDYAYRSGKVLATQTPQGTKHFHLDHLATVRATTDSSGARTAYHVYYPFGAEATLFNQNAERMKFTGHERDLSSLAGAGDDLDYMHARHVSPLTGRFLSVDRARASLLKPQSLNRYAYALGNPVNRVDRNGLWSTSVHNQIIDRALPGLSAAQRQVLKGASAQMDNPLRGGQNASRAYQHAMRNSEQTPDQARQQSMAFYKQQIESAKNQQAAAAGPGLDAAALATLGKAIHLMTDAVSPAHAGFQLWAPLADPLESMVVHPAGEAVINATEMSLAIGAVWSAFAEVFGEDALQEAARVVRKNQRALESAGDLFNSACFYHGTCSMPPQ